MGLSAMGSFKDLSGETYGELKVIERHVKDQNHRWRWLCQCSCGEVVVVQSGNLRSGNTESCGSGVHREGKTLKDLVGQTFGELTVISHNKELSRVSGKTQWNCVCSCGTEKIYSRIELIHKNYKTCGIFGKHLNSNSRKMAFWSERVKEKYDYTCQKCGDKEGKMNSHHILSYTKYPEKRFDLDNGSCLCQNCHYKFHSLFGVMTPGRSELEEFLNRNEMEGE